MRRIQTVRHEFGLLSPLAAGHIQMGEIIAAAKRTRYVALHRRIQMNGTGTIVRIGSTIGRRINGDVDAIE